MVAQDVDPQYRVPSFRAFPSVRQGDGLWERIRWADWGSIDRESFRSLAAILARFSGPDTVAFAHPAFLADPNAGLRGLPGFANWRRLNNSTNTEVRRTCGPLIGPG